MQIAYDVYFLVMDLISPFCGELHIINVLSCHSWHEPSIEKGIILEENRERDNALELVF